MSLYRSLSFVRPLVLAAVLGLVGVVPLPSDGSAILDEAPEAVPLVRSAASDLPRLRAEAFLENGGQIDNAEVLFYTANRNFQVGLATGAVLLKIVEKWPLHKEDYPIPDPHDVALPPPSGSPSHGVLLHLRFEDANNVVPRGLAPLSYPSHFFLGNDPARWRTNVRSYREVAYENLYDGVDLVYRATARGVKYEFRLRPGVDPAVVAMTYEGAERLIVMGTGDLRVLTSSGDFVDSAPAAFQGRDGVPCTFVLRSRSSYGYDCRGVDPSRPLVIDPLVYSTYLGGAGDDVGYSVAVDDAGNAYVTGHTWSADFPATAGAFNTTLEGSSDAFVAKLDPAGANLAYATFLGGGSEDRGLSIAVDATGDSFVAGTTFSTDFPVTPGANDTSYNGDWDAFVVKLDPAGAVLVYASYLGGGVAEEGRSIAVDDAGNVYVTGYTNSANFPVTPGAFDTSYVDPWGFVDIFLARLDPASSSLLYSTYVGGSGRDFGVSIAVDAWGNATVIGYTNSTDFPVTPGANDTTYNGGTAYGDAFVAKVDPAGATLIYATFLGGGSEDQASSVAIDGAGAAYVTGITQSLDFPAAAGALDTSLNGSEDAFVAKLDSTGTSLLYATYLGGTGRETFRSFLALDVAGNVYAAGLTNSTDFPVTPDANDTTYNGGTASGGDAFVAKLDSTGTSLLYATYLGGTADDVPYAIAVGASGEAYVVGGTDSTDFPATPGVFGGTHSGGGRDAFVAKLTLRPSAPDLAVFSADIGSVPPGPVTTGTNITIEATVHNLGDRDASPVLVRYHDGLPSGGNQIGTDQILPFIPAFGGSGLASVNWTAGPPGVHDLCAVADADDTIAEGDEANNLACVTITVDPSLPDYAPMNPQPTSVTVGLLLPVAISLEVWNEGTGPGTGVATLALYNESMPGTPFATFSVPPLGPSTGFGPVVAMWTAPGAAGVQRVVGDVDYGDVLTETDEMNNRFTWTISVVPPPLTLLRVGEPNHTAAATFVNSSTPLSFTVLDRSGAGIRLTRYRIDEDPWNDYASAFALNGEGAHAIEWFSEDNAGNTEAVKSITLWVDDTPPQTTITREEGHVTQDSRFTLSARDSGVGVAGTEYRVDGGPWTPYTEPFSLPQGEHTVGYRSVDYLDNREEERTFSVTVGISLTTQQGAWFWWLLLLLAAGIAVVGLRRNETLLVRFRLPFVPLWARLRREDILDNEKRVLVRGYLAANPGANFAAIRSDLGMGVGTLAYHLWVLETEGIIKSWRDGRLRRYAPSEHRMAARQPRLTDIELFLLQSIRRSPEITQQELAEEVGVSQPAISYHMTRMEELGIVRVERRGLRRRYSVRLSPAADGAGDGGGEDPPGDGTP